MKSQADVKRSGLVFIIGILFLFSSIHSAPSFWTARNQRKMLNIEFLKPFFDGHSGNSPNVVAYFINCRLPLSKTIFFICELPVVHVETKSPWYSKSETTIGNPYLGIEIQKSLSPVFTEIGIRVPVSSENNGKFYGFYSDYVDHLEAFSTDFFQIACMLNYQHRETSGFAVRLRCGMLSDINTGNKYDGETSTNLYLLHGAEAGWHFKKAFFGIGLASRWDLNKKESGYFYPRHYHQMGFKLGLESGTLQPAIHLRLPMDDNFENVLDAVVGLSVAICFP
jgi:hypothetical protein